MARSVLWLLRKQRDSRPELVSLPDDSAKYRSTFISAEGLLGSKTTHVYVCLFVLSWQSRFQLPASKKSCWSELLVSSNQIEGLCWQRQKVAIIWITQRCQSVLLTLFMKAFCSSCCVKPDGIKHGFSWSKQSCSDFEYNFLVIVDQLRLKGNVKMRILLCLFIFLSIYFHSQITTRRMLPSPLLPLMFWGARVFVFLQN